MGKIPRDCLPSELTEARRGRSAFRRAWACASLQRRNLASRLNESIGERERVSSLLEGVFFIGGGGGL